MLIMDKIKKENVKTILPLTSLQKGMLFQYIEGQTCYYLEQFTVWLKGNVNIGSLQQAWIQCVRRYDTLRTVFRWENLKEPIQIILNNMDISFEILDYTALSEEELNGRLNQLKKNGRHYKFDLSKCCFNIKFVRCSNNRIVMVFNCLNILYDGWSLGILLYSLFQTYQIIVKKESVYFDSKATYADYIKWYMNQNRQAFHQYWKNYLCDFEEKTKLPFANGNKIIEHAVYRHELSVKLKNAINVFCKENCVTPAAVYYTAWGYLLQRYNNANDVMFGSVVSGRNSAFPHIEEVVGLLTNCIPFRFKTEENVRVLDAIHSVNTDLVLQGQYEATPLSEIKKYCENVKDVTLFDSIMVIENYPLPRMAGLMPEVEITDFDLWEDTNFDLLIRPMNNMNHYMSVQYEKGKFNENGIRLLVSYYEFILEQMVTNSNCELIKINICSSYNDNQINQWNHSEIFYDDKQILPQLFDLIADKNKDKIAIECYQDSITYYDLQKKANQFAHHLRTIGIEQGDRVAVFMERSIQEVIVILGILKANAVCVPLDADFPLERVKYILANSESKCVVKSNGKVSFQEDYFEIIYEQSEYDCLSNSEIALENHSEDTAYVIYTSGSTGNPKGALINARGIINHAYAKMDALEVYGDDKIANNFSINVIASIWQMWTAICAGATMRIYSKQLGGDIYELLKQSERDRVSVLEIIPSQLSTYLSLIENGEPKLQFMYLRKLALTSEEIYSVVARKFYNEYSGIQLVNCYGQTECSDDVLHYVIPHDNMPDRIYLGQPARNTRILILNSYGMKQPIGFIGEICVDGDGVCNGYWKADELSKDKFIETPYTNGRKIYRTGDLGLWNEKGYVEFRGRCDYQIKIRGNRIELGEIDRKILEIPEISNAVTIAVKSKNNSTMLRTFYESNVQIAPEKIRLELSKKLSPVMIPSEFIALKHIPALANDKVDRKALQTYEYTEQKQIKAEKEEFLDDCLYEIEKEISSIWSKVLRMESFAYDTSFFECGGDSLSILQVKSQVNRTYKLEIPTYEFFRNTTIAALSKLIYDSMKQKEDYKELSHNNSDSLNEMRNSSSEDGDSIAIIGIACRVPGADNLSEFRNMIYEGDVHVSTLDEPKQGLYKAGNHINRWGKLENIDQFDAELFKYSRGEAEITDPQHRVLLECIWEALENAGCNIHDNNHIGVFTTSGPSTYLYRNIITNPEIVDRYGDFQIEIGNDKDFLATKISYKLNLDGPSINVQTACSSSLLAVHLASQSVLRGECDIAIAAGVSIHVPQEEGYTYTEGSHMSKSGNCKPFEAASDGTVFGNGAGVVILKRFQDALRDRDHVYSILKGSAVNNDGNDKISYTAPSIDHQISVIRQAIKNANVTPDTVGYIETHGTGTKLGDAIEIAALREVYKDNKVNYKCAIGSIKANIGHLDVASGVIGLCKTALVLERGEIPPSKYFVHPNPEIDFGPFYVTNKLQVQWPVENGPRRAGVSSFGIGGTNVHIILEQSEENQKTEEQEAASDENLHIISLSGASAASVIAYRKKLLEFLKYHTDINLKDIAYTLRRREHKLGYRNCLVCATVKELQKDLCEEPVIQTVKKNSVVFLFSGQGIDYGAELMGMYDLFPIYRKYVDECASIIFEYMQIDFVSCLRAQCGKKEQTDIVLQQLTIFVHQYSYAMALINLKIHPEVIIGHSFGEYVCACVSGLFTLRDTIYLVYNRALLLRRAMGGAMLSVNLSQQEAEQYCNEAVSLAVINSPDFSVLSGSESCIDSLKEKLTEKGIYCKLLPVNIAYHSNQLNGIRDEFRKVFLNVEPKNSNTAWISTVTGDYVSTEKVCNSDYWCSQLCDTVLFAESVTRCISGQTEKRKVFVEMNSQNVLGNYIKSVKSNSENNTAETVVLTKRKDIHAYNRFLYKLAELWSCGIEIDWSYIWNSGRAKLIELPNYAFDKERFWIDAADDNNSLEKLKNSKRKNEAMIYSVKWIQEDSLNRNKDYSGNTTLIFTESRETYLQIADQASGCRGGKFLQVSDGNGFSHISEDTIEINRNNYVDYISLFEKLQKQTNILDILLPLTESVSNEKNTIVRFRQAQQVGLYRLAYIAKALQKINAFDEVHIAVVTKDVFDVIGNENLNCNDSTVMAACKVIPQELSWIHCKHIDLTAGMSRKENLNALVSEYIKGSDRHTVAYRYGRRWVQQFQLQKQSYEGTDFVLRENGTYVIFGGLGHIGLCVARMIAQKVNANIVLINRSSFVPRCQWDKYIQLYRDDKALRIEALQSIEKMGSKVEIFQTDIADTDGLCEVKKTIEERYGTIHGIIHSAGLVGANQIVPIEEWTTADCEKHFNAKVSGLFSLNDVFLKENTLDFCMYMSSLSTILGGLGSLSYAAANTFMTTFAKKSNKRGKTRQVCINWDMWSYVNRQNTAYSFRENGIDDATAAACIYRILNESSMESCFEVSMGDLNEKSNIWNEHMVSQVPLLSDSTHSEKAPLTYNEIVSCIAEVWKELFHLNAISENDDFFEIGGHSLLAIQMISRMREKYGINIRVKDVFDYSTIHKLAAFICNG